jgi:hypothetical protein
VNVSLAWHPVSDGGDRVNTSVFLISAVWGDGSLIYCRQRQMTRMLRSTVIVLSCHGTQKKVRID